MNKTVSAVSLMALATFSPIVALAQSVPFDATLPDGGSLDNLLAHVVQQTSGWMDNSLAYGQTIFWTLAGLTGVIMMCRYFVRNQTLAGVHYPIMDYYMAMIPLIVVLGALTDFLPKLIGNAELLAAGITGSTIMGPSEVVKIGTQLMGTILHSTGTIFTSGPTAPQVAHSIVGSLTSSNPAVVESALSPVGFNAPHQATPNVFLQTAAGVVGLIGAAFVLFTFTVLAVQLFLVQANIYITLSVCALSLGWMASPATKHMAESYIGAAWKSILSVVLTIACIAFVTKQIPLMQDMSANTDPQTMITTILLLCSSSLFCAILAIKLPSMAINLLTGNPSIGAHDAGGVLGRMSRFGR